MKTKYTLPLLDVDSEDQHLGRKIVGLGQLVNIGIPLPPSFVIPPLSFHEFLKYNLLEPKIMHLLHSTNVNDEKSVKAAINSIHYEISRAKLPQAFITEVVGRYKKMRTFFDHAVVEISASLPDNSLVTQETHRLSGDANLLLAIKSIYSSIFSSEYLRVRRLNSLLNTNIAILVRKIILPVTSGVIYTVDPQTKDKKTMRILAAAGYTDDLILKDINPDEYIISKTSLGILEKKIKTQNLIWKWTGTSLKKHTIKPLAFQKITDAQISELADFARKIEKETFFPQECFFTISSSNKIYISDSRALSIKSRELDILSKQPVLIGNPASPGMASGSLRIISSKTDLDKIASDEIAVLHDINPEFLKHIKKSAAIITDKEIPQAIIQQIQTLGIPAISHTIRATKNLKNGQHIIVNASTGKIFASLPTTHEGGIRTATKVYVNLTNADKIAALAKQHIDGVGIFDPYNLIKAISIHPGHLIKIKKEGKLIDLLPENLNAICKSFSPRAVFYKTSTLTSGEYHKLAGGRELELELEVVKITRNRMNNKNLNLLIPAVITVSELLEIKKRIASMGLYRSPTFKINLLVQIPSNILLIDRLIQTGIDGLTIDLDKLSMFLNLSDNKESEAMLFDDANEALAIALKQVLQSSKDHNLPVTLYCSQSIPNSEILEQLVKNGLHSLSVNPESVTAARYEISGIERRLIL